MFLTEDVSSLIRGSNPFIHPTFQYFVTAANEDPRVASGRCAANSKEKGPIEMGPLTFYYYRYLSCSPSI
jgi:hypothetical protein